MKETFYITTPIYYANSLPHLGHLYTTVVADAVSRFKRQRGADTYFLTGTDEHGINIQRAAAKNGRSPQEQTDIISDELKRMFADYGLDTSHGGYDVFMRTTEPFHYEGAANFWRNIAKNKTPKGNDTIYKGHYDGWFCAPCAAFKTEDEYETVEGEKTPQCLIHRRPLDWVSEESYFFRLSDYQEFLLELIEGNAELVSPVSRRNEVISFIKSGLQDLSISREKKNVSWGISVPGDDDHVMYVWLDALSNYITAIGYGNEERAGVGFDKYWENVTHLVGKDILRFHTVYWFSFLHAAGLPLPKKVFAHGLWLDADGRKMSKTIGNVIDVDFLHKHFQVDAVRYFLIGEMVFGQDGKFGYENLIEKANADLANGLGNLASRTFSMIAKYCDNKVPTGRASNVLGESEAEFAENLEAVRDGFDRHFSRYEFDQAVKAVWGLIAKIDKMITDAKPWILAKDDDQQDVLDAVLYRSAEALRWISVLVFPIMPQSCEILYSQLGLSDGAAQIDPQSLSWGGLSEGSELGESEGIFPRIDKVKVMSEIERDKEFENKEITAVDDGIVTETKEEDFITIDDFLKVQLKVGEIKVAEPVPNADKLLRFEVDLGEEKPRQILAGLAQYYEPEKLIGRKVVVVANLKPRKMRGLESQGMICAASLENDSGPNPALATFLESVENGARLK